jgi:TolA-binding protein
MRARDFILRDRARIWGRRAPTLPPFLVIAVVLSASLAGCAYFNLFYNAKRAFNEGEKLGEDVDPRNQPTTAQRSKYQIAIRKCEMMLDEYPDSDLIDDALFLMGKSHFRLKEWSDALRNFDNLLANFPGSEFQEEAMYLKSLAHLGRGEEELGLEWFQRLRENFPDGQFGAESVYRIGDAYAESGNTEEAIRYYEQFLQDHPSHPARADVILSLGRVYLDAEMWAEAVQAFERAEPDRMSQRERFEVQLGMIRALNAMERSAEAFELLPVLEETAISEADRAEAKLVEGQVLLALGREDDGIFVLESLAAQMDGRAEEGEARAQIIEYLLRERGPEDPELLEQVEVAIADRTRGEYGQQIQLRSRQLSRYSRLKEQVAEGDSTAASAAFDLGELLLVDLQRPGDALHYYRESVRMDPDAPTAPRAAFAIGFILQAELDQPDSAQVAFDRLRLEYPDSPQARSLDGEVFLEAKPRSASELAALEAGLAGGSPPDASVRASDSNGGRRFGMRRSLERGGPGALSPRERGSR